MNISRSARIVGTIIGTTGAILWELAKLAFLVGCSWAIILGAATWLS